ncbi:MAG: MBL fold metallo-hydrolase [Oscillospiraceae bacterium]|nr:MBL fold metallo-hydrolase [Oscillospiraceae bacterium]
MNLSENPKGLIAALLAMLLVFIGAVLYENGFITEELYLKIISAANPGISADSELEVHFIDVGQAECILIKAPEKTVLIDAGDIGYGKTIERYLRTEGVITIDYFIVTHPHADHIGSAADILRKFPVAEVIMPEIPSEYLPATSLFEDFLKAIKRKNCVLSYSENGRKIELGGGAFIEILGPAGYSGDNLNNYSVISKLRYGETSFLFTGDAEEEAELLLLGSGADVSCDVLNAGHHGSSTSNCAALLKAADPQYAAISCGYNNDYGHPHRETLAAFRDFGIGYFRTDYDGSIVFGSDGKTLEIFTEG